MNKPIIGYEGIYEIDENGVVYSLPRNGTISNVRKLKINTLKSGYQQYILQKGGKIKGFLVHRLVAKAFIPNPENKPCVNHKDGCKSNNFVENLEWVTISENEKHAHRNKLKNFKGRRVKRKKTTKELCEKVKLEYISTETSYVKLAIKYNLSKTHIETIIKRMIW